MNFNQSFLMEGEGAQGGGGGGAGDATLFSAAGATGQGSQSAQGSQAAEGGAGSQAAQGSQSAQGGNPAFSWTAAIGEDGSFKPDWTSNLPDDLKPAADTLKNYKTPVEALRALHSTKQLLGANGNKVAIPTATSKPEEIQAFRKAIGAPEKPEEYGLARPADLPKEIEWDDATAKKFGDIMHKHNVPKAAAMELFSAEIESQKAQVEQRVKAEKQFIADGITHLRGEWGEAFNQNMAKAQSMLTHLGLDEKHPALAFPEVVMALYKAHSIIASEDGRVQGQSIIGNDPGVEAKRIMTDENHAMHKQYMSGEPEAVKHVRALLERAQASK